MAEVWGIEGKRGLTYKSQYHSERIGKKEKGNRHVSTRRDHRSTLGSQTVNQTTSRLEDAAADSPERSKATGLRLSRAGAVVCCFALTALVASNAQSNARLAV